MTGFGRSLIETSSAIQQWEVRSVNSRHLEIKWHLPPAARSLETRLEKVVRAAALRGNVGVSLHVRLTGEDGTSAVFKDAEANSMIAALRALAKTNGDDFRPDYNALLSVRELWDTSGESIEDEIADQLESGLVLALEDWNESRDTEGDALVTDIRVRILRMEEWTGLLSDRAPVVKEERLATLRERLSDALAALGQELEEQRFLQEAVVLADRLDVSEELTRLDAHLARLLDLLRAGGDVGRRLDFTLQECFREINTLGNKLTDVQLSRVVVDFKNELEKCREQVQNLE
jgi:uncharacterized protein (TIGR00255 family)